MVREVSDACKRYKLKFGVYLSPWDRNHAQYGTPEYLTYYRSQLRELLTNYGPIFEIWFDGANGGDGYYGGAKETRQIDNKTYYDWSNTWSIVRELQPDACMFSDAGPDTRWVGNESGRAGDPCWATISPEGMSPGNADPAILNRGMRDGTHWIPAEVDVSIRPGWFYHASEDSKVKTPQDLLHIYYESVGRGANLLLNLPPDRRGQLHENDAQALKAWRGILEATFKTDLARGAKVIASNTRGGDAQFAPKKALDGKRDTYWATDDSIKTPEITLEFKQPVTFSVVRLREYLPLGQRVGGYAVDAYQNGAWQEIAKGESIGNCRLIRTKPTTAQKVRLRITSAPVCPAISEFGLFLEPDGK